MNAPDLTTRTTAAPWFSGEDIAAAVSPRRARELIERALRSGFDPASDPARTHVAAGEGHLLLMPSVIGPWTGTKVASVSPGNPERGLPRIQAVYVLMDTQTLTPRALLQGDGLTALRTPAVSAVAADRMTVSDARKLVVFGTGPQALAHIEACADIRDFREVVINGRQESGVQTAVDFARGLGLAARAGSVEDVADADLVVCATSSGTPLFDGGVVPDSACVVAMGSHEPDRRELDTGLVTRSQVVVEDTGTALREAGDVIMAAEGSGDPARAVDLVELVDLVNDRVAPDWSRPRVFKGVGMSWQDLAVAGGVVETMP
ncbi:ornithine cyclodeaminase family protein [Kocuria sp. JC486]|uniref:ornithine cyclodeaminase family protein n=1 Tax=Kocuria sp. JC486 TaxID=1970736 RepID=UPI0032AF82A3